MQLHEVLVVVGLANVVVGGHLGVVLVLARPTTCLSLHLSTQHTLIPAISIVLLHQYIRIPHIRILRTPPLTTLSLPHPILISIIFVSHVTIGSHHVMTRPHLLRKTVRSLTLRRHRSSHLRHLIPSSPTAVFLSKRLHLRYVIRRARSHGDINIGGVRQRRGLSVEAR